MVVRHWLIIHTIYNYIPMHIRLRQRIFAHIIARGNDPAEPVVSQYRLRFVGDFRACVVEIGP